MTGYYHCRRKRDGAMCIVWFYENARGEQLCSCARTHKARPADFEVLERIETFEHPAMAGAR